MILKRIIIWILKGLILLFLSFATLIFIDSVVYLEWLTDEAALRILVFVFLLYCALTFIKHRKKIHHKAKARTKRIDSAKPVKMSPLKLIAAVIAVELIICAGLKIVYKDLLDKSLIDVPLDVINLANGESLLGNNLKDVPETIVEFGEKYPEAKEYVRNYNKYKNVNFDIDVSKEMSERDIPLFIQWDKRWGYRDYGGNYIGVAGCGPTCLAMVVCGLEKDPDVNPYNVSSYSADSGYYIYGEGTSWNMMTEGARHYGLDVSDGVVSESYILNNLSNSTPMICSMTKGDFTTAGHFIVLTDIDNDGKIIVNDPNSPKNSKKHWDVAVLVSQMRNIWRYSV